MRCRLTNVARDMRSKMYLITLATEDVTPLEEVRQDKDLDVQVKEYRKKRSLDANAYCWLLLTKLANALNSTKEEVYEEMLRRTGFIDENNIIAIPDDKEIESYPGHWLYILTEDEWATYVRIRGSSEYDSKEMSVFIDNIIDECKSQGIETMTPEEIERLKKLWKA